MSVEPYNANKRLQNTRERVERQLSEHNFTQLDSMRLEMLASSKQKEHRITNILRQFNVLAPHIDFKLDQANRQDLLQLVRKINQDEIGEQDHSIWTLCEYKKALKAYYSWLTGKEHPEILDFMKVHPKEREKPKVSKDELLNVRQVEKMINACSNPRDKVFLAMLWDSGARLSELLTLRWKDLVFEDNMVRTHIWNGKHRPRNIYLVESVPLLRRWREWKSQRTTLRPEMPVLTNYRPHDSTKNLSARNAAKQIQDIRDRICLPDRIRTNPHAWRKARATDLAGKGMSQPNLNLQFGWAPGSDASKYYIKLAEQDLERSIREIYPGLSELEEEGPEFIGWNIPEYTEAEVENFSSTA